MYTHITSNYMTWHDITLHTTFPHIRTCIQSIIHTSHIKNLRSKLVILMLDLTTRWLPNSPFLATKQSFLFSLPPYVVTRWWYSTRETKSFKKRCQNAGTQLQYFFLKVFRAAHRIQQCFKGPDPSGCCHEHIYDFDTPYINTNWHK